MASLANPGPGADTDADAAPDTVCVADRIVMIDCGSLFTKIGYVGDDVPRDVFLSTSFRKYPGQGHLDWDWDALERNFRASFARVGAFPENRAVYLVEPVFAPPAHRERMAQFMFEKLGVEAFTCHNACLLSHRSDEVVLESGDGVTRVLPVYCGYELWHAAVKVDFAGRDITDHLMACLADERDEDASVIDYASPEWRTFVREEIKEKHCYVALDFDEEMRKWQEHGIPTQHEFTDGAGIKHIIIVGDAIFRCAEALFCPSLAGKDGVLGIHEAVSQSLQKVDVDARPELNLRLAGGNTMLNGFVERIAKELDMELHTVLATSNRQCAAWVGGSLFGTASGADIYPPDGRSNGCPGEWMTQAMYNKIGPVIAHTRKKTYGGNPSN